MDENPGFWWQTGSRVIRCPLNVIILENSVCFLFPSDQRQSEGVNLKESNISCWFFCNSSGFLLMERHLPEAESWEYNPCLSK